MSPNALFAIVLEAESPGTLTDGDRPPGTNLERAFVNVPLRGI